MSLDVKKGEIQEYKLDAPGIVQILRELGILIQDAKTLKFSTGKWSKAWVKIEYERLQEDK